MKSLWWDYLCTPMANIGILKEAQSKLMALGVDFKDAGIILSGVQKFYIDTALEAAKRYEEENGIT